jgi:hypothetical protein
MLKNEQPNVLSEEQSNALELMYEAGWTDGLPVVTPYKEKVEEFIAASGLPSHEEIGAIPPLSGRATIEKIAANAVMAGCLPGYMPVVIAAVDAVLDPKFNLRGMQGSTHMATPMIIVNGPIRKKLKINSGSNVFGQGWRANATIGRALKLVLTNIGGAIPGQADKSTFGHPGKYTYCIAENEERSPWEPFHVERGFASEESTVTVYGAEGPHNVTNQYSSDPESLLLPIISMMTNLGSNQPYMMGDNFIVLSPEHAGVIAQAGWKKADIKNFIFENARIPVGQLKIGGFYGPNTDRYMLWPRWINRHKDDELMPVCRRVEDIKILVAGGPGKHSAYIPGLGSKAATRKISI